MSVKQLLIRKEQLENKKAALSEQLGQTREFLKNVKLEIRAAIAEEKSAKIAGKEKAAV